MPRRLCRRIHRREVRGNVCVRVEAVHDVEQLCKCRGLLRQIGRRTAAENQNINLILPLCRLVRMNNRHVRARLHRRRVTPCKDGDQLHILICFDGILHAASEIAIAKNTNTNHKNSSRHPPKDGVKPLEKQRTPFLSSAGAASHSQRDATSPPGHSSRSTGA